MRAIVWAGLAIGSATLFAGYFGSVHPAFDSIGAFRVQVLSGLVAVGALAVLSRRRKAAALTALVIAAGGLTLVPHVLIPTVKNPSLTLLQANLLHHNHHHEFVARMIRRINADVVTLQEVGPNNEAALTTLADLYPHQVVCKTPDRKDVAILSQLPIGPNTLCDPHLSLAAAEILTNEGPILVHGFHARWPWPYGQSDQFQKVASYFEGLDVPTITAGDFNMTPWGHAVREVAKASGSAVAPGLAPTIKIRKGLVRLRIDHVLCPEAWTCQTWTQIIPGSDHIAVFARIARPE